MLIESSPQSHIFVCNITWHITDKQNRFLTTFWNVLLKKCHFVHKKTNYNRHIEVQTCGHWPQPSSTQYVSLFQQSCIAICIVLTLFVLDFNYPYGWHIQLTIHIQKYHIKWLIMIELRFEKYHWSSPHDFLKTYNLNGPQIHWKIKYLLFFYSIALMCLLLIS